MLAEPKLSFYSITEGAEINKAKSGRDNSRALKDEQTISLMTRWMTKQVCIMTSPLQHVMAQRETRRTPYTGHNSISVMLVVTSAAQPAGGDYAALLRTTPTDTTLQCSH